MLTNEQAFEAMFEYLSSYWAGFKTANVADVLGDINPATNGQSSDPAAWSMWLEAVHNVSPAKDLPTSSVDETPWQVTYRQEAQVLGEIGLALSRVEFDPIDVRLPRSLAEQALAAWNGEDDTGPLDPETHEQRTLRHRAGTLGLIGLSIENQRRWDDDDMIVPLHPGLIGDALTAADDLPGDDHG